MACWGLDDEGQSTPPAGTFTTLSAGADHTCGILETGWRGFDVTTSPAPPAGIFTTVSAGADHTCGILDTGAVACWGLDDEGQSTPPAGTFTTVSAGADHTCGILETGVVACWGLDDEGQSAPPGRATTPDLVVASPLVSDSNPDAGAFFTFTLSATVRNEGDGASAAITLRYYRSADATITASDTAVGTDAVAGLAASGTSEQAISLTAPSTPGTYYYGVCVDTVTDESDTTNNCSASVQVTVPEPERPDLEMGTPTVDDARPETGATFTLSVTVSNTGDGESSATTLRYYRSTDATITTSDMVEGTAEVGALAASGTSEQSISLTAPAPGTYYYGTCVDTVTDESDTTNNCSAPVQVGVEAPTYPDLEMGTPTVDDTTLETGASFTLSVTVSNTGDGESSATTLRYYRSTDATITTSDTVEGTADVGALAASGTSEQSISLTVPAPGTYYYGTCVDTVTDESDTTNNCSAPVQVGVEAPTTPDLEVGKPEENVEATYPDLEVETPTVDDTTPETGASFTLSATVRNAGDGESSATTLRYYRSTDATITTSDMVDGTADVGALAASGTSEQSISLTAPAPGTYYYGTCVDTVTDESDTTNNCSAPVQVTVPEPQPDLVVAASVEDGNLNTDDSFTLSATVRNVGDEQSVATTLRYYRSTDVAITSSDTEIGTDAVGELAASGTSADSISLTAPSTAGTYYYGACVDAVTDESDTTNNCSSSVTIAVEEESSGQPDLRIVGVIAVTSLDGVFPGSLIQLSATVRNYGDANSDATTLRYYRSTDATISALDTQVGTDEVSALAPSVQVSEGIDLTAPSLAGTYYYGACVDAVTGEADTTNNCSSSVTVTVSEPQTSPDLSVGSPTVNDSSLETGGAFTLSATVSNAGDGESSATTLHYYRSTDATITTSDTAEGTDEVGTLSASGTSEQSISLTAPAPGTYYYGACVDTVTGESDTTDNCSGSVQVDVQEPAVYPDLSVGSPTVDDSSPETGASFTLSATVSNAGDGESGATTLHYYRSTDATITTSDTSMGTDAVGALAAAGTSSESISLTAPSTAGTYYYGACVDTVTDESDTTNNCSSSVTVTVAEPELQPDLTVDSFTITLGPTLETSPGALVYLNQRVANVGDAGSAATTVRYYRSTDATITTSDTQVSTDAVPELAASSRFAEVHSERLPTAPGTYYYGACVDAVAGESNTANNCSRSVKVTVPEPQPDLVVGSASVDDSNLNTGDSFTLSATVRNAGDEQSAATTLRYYRSTDSRISSSDTEIGTDAVGALAASGTSAGSITLTAPSTAGTYYYGACVDTATDESDTTNNCSSSVTIAVEEASSGQPDLRIVGVIAVTSLDGVFPGSLIQLSATVRNYGDANSDATTLRYYRSADATISVSDTEVGTDEVSALAPSAQVSEGIHLTAPSPAGTYYYGACVDPVAGESDTTNNCSSSVQVVVSEPEPETSPDLMVGSASVDDSSPETGASFTLSATVSNAGDGESVATTLRYYRSTDVAITSSDTAVGTDAVGVLAASATSPESISLTAPEDAGTYYYGVCVDPVAGESDTTNNCSGSVQVVVSESEPETSPDLMVGSASVDDSSPETGASFTLSATANRRRRRCATTARQTWPSPHRTPRLEPTRWACWQRQRPARSQSPSRRRRMPARTTTARAWIR